MADIADQLRVHQGKQSRVNDYNTGYEEKQRAVKVGLSIYFSLANNSCSCRSCVHMPSKALSERTNATLHPSQHKTLPYHDPFEYSSVEQLRESAWKS